MIGAGFGRQVCGSLTEASAREWLVADGLGGFAMGTVGGLRTRRYHGLLIVATAPPIGRRLALASLDPALVIGDRRLRLATHEWASGAVDPNGYTQLTGFAMSDGVPRWRWAVGGAVLEREVAMVHGSPAVGVVHRLVRASGPVRLELDALCTWRDVHGERFAAGEPTVALTADGFEFEGAYRVRGPGFEPGGAWYAGARYREEAARGLNDREDLWWAGRFVADVAPGDVVHVEAWAGPAVPPSAVDIVSNARRRAAAVIAQARPADGAGETLALAADQFVAAGPTVVAGYPWFGDWSRDTMTSYEGLFLTTNRFDDGRALLERAAALVSEGMLANTADVGGQPEFNTVDAAMWFLHAVARHAEVAGDDDLATAVLPTLEDIVRHHIAGTRFGIGVDLADGLITQGAEGWALTWMDARVDGVPVTARQGKPVEVNALWVSGLTALARMQLRVGRDVTSTAALAESARRSFVTRFPRPDGGGLYDVIDGPGGDDPTVRPNQLLAVSLPDGPLRGRRDVVEACAPLLTSIGLRSLAPDDPRYLGRHRGGPAERDRAYHMGTVWPWLIGPFVDAATSAGAATEGLLDGLVDHLSEWGLGSVSETADGDPPHAATGCPFQAWSVAELLRARRRLGG